MELAFPSIDGGAPWVACNRLDILVHWAHVIGVCHVRLPGSQALCRIVLFLSLSLPMQPESEESSENYIKRIMGPDLFYVYVNR